MIGLSDIEDGTCDFVHGWSVDYYCAQLSVDILFFPTICDFTHSSTDMFV